MSCQASAPRQDQAGEGTGELGTLGAVGSVPAPGTGWEQVVKGRVRGQGWGVSVGTGCVGAGGVSQCWALSVPGVSVGARGVSLCRLGRYRRCQSVPGVSVPGGSVPGVAVPGVSVPGHTRVPLPLRTHRSSRGGGGATAGQQRPLATRTGHGGRGRDGTGTRTTAGQDRDRSRSRDGDTRAARPGHPRGYLFWRPRVPTPRCQPAGPRRGRLPLKNSAVPTGSRWAAQSAPVRPCLSQSTPVHPSQLQSAPACSSPSQSIPVYPSPPQSIPPLTIPGPRPGAPPRGQQRESGACPDHDVTVTSQPRRRLVGPRGRPSRGGAARGRRRR